MNAERPSAADLLRLAAQRESPLAPPSPWVRLSERYSEDARMRTGREHVLVTVAPGVPGGPPGCYVPDLGVILLDGELLPATPDFIDTEDVLHRDALAVMHGVFLHEVGHAHHTTVALPADGSPASTAARLLEEIRMEAAAVRDDAGAARFLRAAARKLIVGEQAVVGPGLAAIAAATLTAGRALAGSLEPEDLEPIREALADALPEAVAAELQTIWGEAIATPDGELEPLLRLADRMVALAEQTAHEATAVRRVVAGADAVGRHAANAAVEELDDEIDDGPGEHVRAVVRGRPGRGPRIVGTHSVAVPTRPPTLVEKRARASLARLLSAASLARVVKADSVVPPGRMRSSQAVRGAADRSRGAPAIARPFRRTVRRRTRDPLRATCLIDLSGSMSPFGLQLASAAWVTTGAVRDAGGMANAVGFDEHTHLLIPSAGATASVPVLRARGAYEEVTDAIALAVADLGGGAVDLVVLVSDGHWTFDETERAEEALAAAQSAGTTVVHIAIADDPEDHGADEVIVIADASQLGVVTGQACLRAFGRR